MWPGTPSVLELRLNVKALEEKALEGAFSVIMKTDGSFSALTLTLLSDISRSTTEPNHEEDDDGAA